MTVCPFIKHKYIKLTTIIIMIIVYSPISLGIIFWGGMPVTILSIILTVNPVQVLK
jgi:hypothetical protein